MCAIALSPSVASGQSVPTDLEGTTWLGGDEIVIKFYEDGKVTVTDGLFGNWTGTYKQKGATVTAKFSGSKTFGTERKKKMTFSAEYYKSKGGQIVMKLKSEPKIEGSDSGDETYYFML